MRITSRTAALCLLAAAGCQSARAIPEPQAERPPKAAPPLAEPPLAEPPPQPEPAPPKRFERDMMVRFHMHQSFDLLRAIEKLLVRGNLDDARAFARAIAEAPDEPGLLPWARHTAVVRERAAALAQATTVEEACRREAQLAEACAGCHADAGVVPEFRPPRTMPPDLPTIDARMARHLWATHRLWEGVVGGAEDAWLAGLDVLAATPLPMPPALGAREAHGRRLQQLADAARRRRGIDTPADRARAYGELLGVCAGCHAAPAARADRP